MAGVTLVLERNVRGQRQIFQALTILKERAGNLHLAFRDVGEYLLLSHDERWRKQQAPDGSTWAPLSPDYKRTKRKNKSKILVLDHYLKDLNYRATDQSLELGTPRVYGAIMHYGFDGRMYTPAYQVPASRRKAHRRKTHTRKDGKVIKAHKVRAHEVQAHKVRGHSKQITIPARPYLGLSAADETEVLRIFEKHFGVDGGAG